MANPAQKKKVDWSKYSQLLLPLLSILLIVVFNLFRDPSFFSVEITKNNVGNTVLTGNLISILNGASELAVLAMGMTLVTAACGGQDISVGALAAIAGSVFVKVLKSGPTITPALEGMLKAFAPNVDAPLKQVFKNNLQTEMPNPWIEDNSWLIKTDKTYEIEITVKDSIDEDQKTVPVKRGTPVFDWGENDFNFNVDVRILGTSIFDIFYPVGSVFTYTGSDIPQILSISGMQWESIPTDEAGIYKWKRIS